MKTKFAKVFLGVLAGLMAAVAIGQVNIQWPSGAPSSGAVLYSTTTSGQLGYSNLLIYGGGGTVATQLSATQTTAPTCLTGCGSSPTVAGTDTAGTVTMGSGSPASPWVVAFNGTWSAAPSCIVISSKAGMASTKAPIVVTTTTTQLGVTNSSVAPSATDTYSYQCFGVK